MIHCLITILLSLLLCTVRAELNSLEVNELGTSVFENQQVSVLFRNLYPNMTISLWWLGIDGATVKMGDIPATSDVNIVTFIGHVFYATEGLADSARLHPSQVTITAPVDTYEFGPKHIASKSYVKLLNTRSSSVNAKFRTFVPGSIDIWFEDGAGGSFQGTLTQGKEYTINTYEGHVFFFTDSKDKTKEYARHVIKAAQVVYVIEDYERPAPLSLLDQHRREERYMEEYYEKTGIQWRHYFGPNGPRAPPVHHMWSAEFVGQVHGVNSSEGYWSCVGTKKKCQSSQPVGLEIEVISTHPKAFVIHNFLNEFESDQIIATADPLMRKSTVGHKDGGGTRESDTRTSRNAWVARTSNDITETLFRRAEHLLKIAPLDRSNTEDMQVVHYRDGQRYDSHHDWGVSGYPESRFVTLLLYLTDMPTPAAGGETAFPKGANGLGFKVQPGKGNAVLFYNLLEDGNGDDLALHAALPVTQGEKWLANFWVWDPKRH